MTSETVTTVDWPHWEDPAFYAQDLDVIHASIAAQRRAEPVYWYDAPGCTSGFWVLSKWADQRYVGSHPDLFSNRLGFSVGDANDPGTVIDQLPPWVQEELRQPGLTPAQTRGLIAKGKLSLGDPELKNMMLMDPPIHGQVRDIFMRALKPSLVRSLRSRMVEVTDEFIEAIEPGSVTDFVTTLGRVPATLMAEVIGVPREDREKFIEMASAHIASISIDPGKDLAEVERNRVLGANFTEYIDNLLDERQKAASTRDDLVSVISRAQLDGAPLSRGVAFVFMTHFLSSGETTRTLLSHLAMGLAEHSDQRRLLAEQPELLANAIEEGLRYYVINWSGCRTATQDVEVGGQVINKDDFVLMAYASANRDEDVWDRPDQFDVRRVFDHDHLGFGHGEHSCPGALLARIFARVIYERLLARYPDWELAGTPERICSPFVQSMGSLPVRFHS